MEEKETSEGEVVLREWYCTLLELELLTWEDPLSESNGTKIKATEIKIYLFQEVFRDTKLSQDYGRSWNESV